MDLRHRIVIARHRPWRRFALVAAGAAGLALGGFALYRYARATTVSDFEHAQLEREQLRAESRDLSQKLRAALNENQRLHDQLAYLNRSQQIEGSACDNVKRSLSSLQSENADLREQLAFYRGIVSPSESQAGVRVFEFKVRKTGQPGTYRYDLVLIQSVRHDKRTDGTAEISIEGYRGGQKQTLKLADLATDNNRNLVFSFKYFQEFSGSFRLPEGFKPQRAAISLVADGAPKIDDDYDWAKIVQESAPS
ncbi:MAG: hypothetical protein QJR02_09480 [Sinobacteraceae bacterium]|nr:hypothetical protein [Nevskia sp.]MDI3259912.1 hypothetical protein [Nevskiaceae bacterium]